MIRFLFEQPVDDEKAWRKTMKDHAPAALAAVRDALAGLDGFDAASVEAALEPIPASLDLKPGKVYQPIRVAITGTTVSPGIFESVAALGREETLARIDAALARLAAAPPSRPTRDPPEPRSRRCPPCAVASDPGLQLL